MNTRFSAFAAILATATLVPVSQAQYNIEKYSIHGGGGVSTDGAGGDYEVRGALGQPLAGDASGSTYGLVGGFWTPEPAVDLCSTAADCADLDGNGIRDDGCVFWECVSETCVGTDVSYADMGGSNGACPPDGTADGNDRFHALNCFSNLSTSGAPGYPCEADSPTAFNVDAAGLGAPCSPDGVCDGNDAFAALNAFSGNTTCSCPSGAAPSGPGGGGPVPVAPPGSELNSDPVVDRVTIELVPSSAVASRGDQVQVDVYITGGVSDLRGYQLHPMASKGLTLVDMTVEDHKEHVFSGQAYWDAYNLDTGQMLVGIDTDGVASTAERLYLATLMYMVGDAQGTLLVDLRYEPLQGRTFLFPTPAAGVIDISQTVPAVITIEADLTREVAETGEVAENAEPPSKPGR